MTVTEPICFSCQHYDGVKNTCPAFPDGVPETMLKGDLGDHKTKVEDQVGDTVYKKGDPNWKS